MSFRFDDFAQLAVTEEDGIASGDVRVRAMKALAEGSEMRRCPLSDKFRLHRSSFSDETCTKMHSDLIIINHTLTYWSKITDVLKELSLHWNFFITELILCKL